MKKKEFVKISVTICQIAEINRGTFYLHYCDVYAVLDELITDMMGETTPLVDHIMCDNRTQGKCTYPFCARIQNETKYQVLFLDESISSILVDKIADAGKEGLLPGS